MHPGEPLPADRLPLRPAAAGVQALAGQPGRNAANPLRPLRMIPRLVTQKTIVEIEQRHALHDTSGVRA